MPDNIPPPPVPHATSGKMSAMAVIALVLGIMGLFSCGSTALLGLIFGIIALTKIRNSGGALKGDGVAIAGISVSACFMILIPILSFAMFLPVLAAAKQRAQTINCINKEKELALAIRIYSGNNTNRFPPAATWCDAIQSAEVAPNVFKDPAVNSGSRCDYAFNAAIGGLDESKVAPDTVMLFESDAGWDASGGPELMRARHQRGRIYVVTYADGSVQEIRASEIGSLRWNP